MFALLGFTVAGNVNITIIIVLIERNPFPFLVYFSIDNARDKIMLNEIIILVFPSIQISKGLDMMNNKWSSRNYWFLCNLY